MAILLLLSVLVTCVSFHGMSANTGCIVSRGSLDNFYQFSKKPLQPGLETYLKALAPLTVSAHFVEVTVAAVVVSKVELAMVPGLGLNVFICSSIHLHCVTLDLVRVTLIADVCVTLQLRGSPLELVIDDCSIVFEDIRLHLLRTSIQVPKDALIALLGGPICQAHTVVCRRLNFPLLVDLAPISLPAGCRYDPFPPRITALSLELPFSAVCAGVPKPQSPALNCSHLYPEDPDNNVVYYTSTEDLTCLLTALLNAKVFDKEITLTSVTTTTILENFPQRGTVGIQATVNCPSRLILVTVTALSAFDVVGSCETGSCVIDSAVAERVFTLRTWCRNILSVNLKETIYLLLPSHISCDACSTGVYRQGCAYFSCSPVFDG